MNEEHDGRIGTTIEETIVSDDTISFVDCDDMT
jgi:hypothetical protein